MAFRTVAARNEQFDGVAVSLLATTGDDFRYLSIVNKLDNVLVSHIDFNDVCMRDASQ